MPIINLKMTKEDGGATKEQKTALIKGLTDVFVDVMGRGEKTTVVTIEEIETDNYGIGGEPVTEIRKSAS
ncbi:MAG: 4-oxalocrotonate tautomerase family protein [Proteobacteria bacterium]|nr:4-oxalocrotonate tautomerase family protein [Pseudomonadota bacterium]